MTGMIDALADDTLKVLVVAKRYRLAHKALAEAEFSRGTVTMNSMEEIERGRKHDEIVRKAREEVRLAEKALHEAVVSWEG